MADKLETIQILFVKRNAAKRGRTSSDDYNDMVDELAHDLAEFNTQWNNRLVPLTATIPDGTVDNDIDAYTNGLSGRHLYVDADATSTSNSTYYNTTDSRPYSIFEQFADVYNEINNLTINDIDLSAVAQHYVPLNDNLWDIGSATSRIRDIYLGPASIKIVALASESEAPADTTYALRVNSSSGELEVVDTTNTEEVVAQFSTSGASFPAGGVVSGIADLDDVSGSPTNGQVLTYLTASGWIPQDTASGDKALNDLTNVVTSPTDGQVLTYVAGNTRWEATTVSVGASAISDLSDVSGSPTDGQVLTYLTASGEWIPQDTASAVSVLNDLTNVQGTPTDGQVLTYVDAQGKWEPATASGGSGTPGGSDTQIQFNDGGSFGGSAYLTFDSSNKRVVIDNDVSTGGHGLAFLVGGNYEWSLLANYPAGFGTEPTFQIYNSNTGKAVLSIVGDDDKVGINTGTTRPTENLTVNGGIKISNASSSADGTIQYSSGDFRGRKGGYWVSLTGDVSATGGPSANQVGVWASSNSLTGSAGLKFENDILKTTNTGLYSAEFATTGSSNRIISQHESNTGFLCKIGTTSMWSFCSFIQTAQSTHCFSFNNEDPVFRPALLITKDDSYVGLGLPSYGTVPFERLTLYNHTARAVIALEEVSSAPSNTADFGKIYVGTDSELHFLDSSNNDTQLTTAPSDVRLKTNIQPITGAVDALMQLNGIMFEWNETAHTYSNKPLNQKQVGLLAQDVEKVLPELVTEKEYKSVKYPELTAVLVEAIKELKTENEDLKQRIERLEKSSEV